MDVNHSIVGPTMCAAILLLDLAARCGGPCSDHLHLDSGESIYQRAGDGGVCNQPGVAGRDVSVGLLRVKQTIHRFPSRRYAFGRRWRHNVLLEVFKFAVAC